MSRFENRTLDQRISKAIIDANRLLDVGSPMLSDIANKDDFKFNSGDGYSVWVALLGNRSKINVFTYRPWNPWTAAIGYFDGKAIHINAKKLPEMSHLALVANLCHEFCHASGFSHGNNYKTKEKCLYSVPYFVSEGILEGKWL
jgi:hypothetical protein